MPPEETQERSGETRRLDDRDSTSLNKKSEEIMSAINFVPRRTITSNNDFLAWLDASTPCISILSHDGEHQGELTFFKSWIIDFCFASAELNIIISVERDTSLWIHGLAVHHDRVVGSTLGRLVFPCDTALSGVGVALPSPHSQENFAAGYLVVGADELTAVQVASVITESGTVDLYDVPRVNFGEGQEIFAICPEGQRLASCNKGAISVFMLPSSAAHMTFTPHGGQEVANIAFDQSSTIITFSNEDHYVHIWDITDLEPHCKHSIRLPVHTYHWANGDVERLLFHSFGSQNVLDLDTMQLSIRDFSIDEKLTKFNYFGWCLSSRKNKDLLCIRLENRLVTYILPRSGGTVLQKAAESQVPLSKLSAQTCCKSQTSSAGSTLYDDSDSCDKDQQIKTYTILPHRDPAKNCNVFQENLRESGKVRSFEEEKTYENMPDSLLDLLEDSIDRVTNSIIRTTQRVSSYHQAALRFESKIESLPSNCGKLVKSHLKERADNCISSLDPAFDGICVEPEVNIDSKAMCAKVAAMPTKLINECLSTYEEKVAQCANQSHKDFDAEIHGLLHKICKKMFPSTELNEYARQVQKIEKDAFVAQSSKNAIAARLQLQQYEQALEIALQSNSTEVLVWLLTEASSMQTWSELVIDEKLSPLNTLSLTFNTCVALSLGSCVYPASLSESLILLVRDTVVMYKKRWSEVMNTRAYNTIRAHCMNLTQSMQKGNARGPLYSLINETIRVLQA